MSRFRAADAAYENVRARLHSALLTSVSGPTPPEQLQALADLHRDGVKVHLELESFYVFSKILLDRAADTFALYFGRKWKGLGSTHMKLVRQFSGFCAERGIDGQAIQNRLDDLGTRIVSYRTDIIEHLGTEDAYRMTTTSLANPTEGVRLHLAGRSTEPLIPLLADLDSYLASLLTFMQAHSRHSIIERTSA